MFAGALASFFRTVRTGAGLAGGPPMNFKNWKSGRHYAGPIDPELLHSLRAAEYMRAVCKYCMEQKRTCPVCAGVI